MMFLFQMKEQAIDRSGDLVATPGKHLRRLGATCQGSSTVDYHGDPFKFVPGGGTCVTMDAPGGRAGSLDPLDRDLPHT